MEKIEIKTIADVESFCQMLYDKYDLAFHPDDPFSDYTNKEGKRLFSDQEAEYLNSVMEKCFEVCEENRTNIYSVMEPIQQ